MGLDGDYDSGNIFAKILRGEIPSARVFEDDATLAFLDVFPQSRGHTLAILKQSRARNLLDVAPQDLATLILTVQRVAAAVKTALRPDGLVVTQFNGAAAGQSVFHLHFHIIPRWNAVPLGRHGEGAMADPADLAKLAAQISAHLA